MRKFFAKTAAALALSAVFMLVGCGGSGMLTQTPNQGISAGSEGVGKYDALAYFEAEEPADVSISFEAEKIQKVSYKYRVLDDEEYTFKNNVLTVKKSVFEGETGGDKRLRVFVNNAYTEITVRVVSKVIYTPEDFDSIRYDLNGVFVLGADIDFGNRDFWPIGKSVEVGGDAQPFEGIFDGRGHSISNLTLNCYDYNGIKEYYDDDGNLTSKTGPSTGDQIGNSSNYNVGIFAETGGSAQIVNTAFYDITVNCQGLGGAVAGANGGLIRNCFVSCTLYSRGACEKAGGIAGMNGSGDAAGKIENCLVVFTYGSGTPRGIADWNVGTIRNCFAAASDNFLYYPDYDPDKDTRDPEFRYDHYLTDLPETDDYKPDDDPHHWTNWIYTNYSIPAFPGTVDTKLWKFYPGGTIINSDVVRKNYLLDPANFPEEDGWDTNIWDFSYGMFPKLKLQQN